MIDRLVDHTTLMALLQRLRLKGHYIPLCRVSDLQFLFLNLREQGLDIQSSTDLAGWVIPIVGRPSSDNLRLRQDLAAWWHQELNPSTEPAQEKKISQPQPFPDDTKYKKPGISPWAIASVASLTLLILVAFFLLIPNNDFIETDVTEKAPTTNQVAPDGRNRREPTQSVGVVQIPWYQAWSPAVLTQPFDRTLVIVLLIIALIAALRKALSYQVVIQRRLERSGGLSKGQRYFVNPVKSDFFSITSLMELVRVFRTQVPSGARDIDINESIAATCDRGGFIELVERPGEFTPEYLLMVQRRNPDEHFSELAVQLQRALVDEHIFVDRYEFRSNPRRCIQRAPENEEIRVSISLEQLIDSHARQRLIIVSDATPFVDLNTMSPYDWVDQYKKLPLRILLTPLPRAHWGDKEQALLDSGFQLFTFDQAGLAELIGVIHDETAEESMIHTQRKPTKTARKPKRIPYEITRNAKTLMQDGESPEQATLERILWGLQGYLRETGLHWLQACAVFPRLHPKLTLHLGSTVQDHTGQPIGGATALDRYLDLCRLPWFQAGHMPDWLRRALLLEMDEGFRNQVVDSLRSFMKARPGLDSAPTGTNTFLEIDSGSEELSKNYFQRLRNDPDAYRESSMPKDHLFLGFMAGDPLQSLSVSAPPTLARRAKRRYLRLLTVLSVLYIGLGTTITTLWPIGGLLQLLEQASTINIAIHLFGGALLLGASSWILKVIRQVGPNPQSAWRLPKLTVTTADTSRRRFLIGLGLGLTVVGPVAVFIKLTSDMDLLTLTYITVLISFLIYALIGFIWRSSSLADFYVARRKIKPFWNGMSIASDWMSAASFVSLAGLIAFTGYGGSVFLMGWTGGYVLLAILVAPYLRKFGGYTVPQFIGDRYYSKSARLIAALCTIAISFTYVIGQMKGIGVAFSRFLEISYEVGLYAGMSILAIYTVLGGMRAITYAQIVQYIVLVFSFTVPAVFLSLMLTGHAFPQLGLSGFIADGSGVSLIDKLDLVVTDLGFKEYSTSMLGGGVNMFVYTLSLMIATAGMPHVAMRFLTVPKVADARTSAAWALLFIAVIYTAVPAIGAMARLNLTTTIQTGPVGDPNANLVYEERPQWFKNWERTGLLKFEDKNGDGRIQYYNDKNPEFAAMAESKWGWKGNEMIKVDRDIMSLANPEIAQLPNWVIAFMAAGALAAALSTAAGLLLAITSAVAHDVMKGVFLPGMSAKQQLLLGRITMVVVIIWAVNAGLSPPGFAAGTVAIGFGLAACSIFPALMMGIFFKHITGRAAVLGMVSGIGVTMFYVFQHKGIMFIPGTSFLGAMSPNWFLGISPNAFGAIGAVVNFAVAFAVSAIMSEKPPAHIQHLVEDIRVPKGARAVSDD